MKTARWIVLVVAIACAATSFVIVDETEHVIVTQFGRPTAVYSDAGLRLKAPAPFQRVTRSALEVSPCERPSEVQAEGQVTW